MWYWLKILPVNNVIVNISWNNNELNIIAFYESIDTLFQLKSVLNNNAIALAL